MLRGILCLIIVVFSSLAGWSKASVYWDRVKELQNLTTNLTYLESEMGYRMEAIPLILRRIGENRRESGGAFFSEVCRLLDQGAELSLYNAWEKGLAQVYGEDVFTEGDRKIVAELGYELGKTDMETQHKLFAHCFTQLTVQMVTAKQEALVKGRMYRGLGVSAGILAAVLFL